MSLLCQWQLISSLRSRKINGGHCRRCWVEECFWREVPRRKKVIVARSIDSQVQAAEWNEQPSGNQNDWTQWNQTNPFKFIQSHVDLFSSLNRVMPLARCVALVLCGFQSRRREQCCLGIIIHNSACFWEHMVGAFYEQFWWAEWAD